MAIPIVPNLGFNGGVRTGAQSMLAAVPMQASATPSLPQAPAIQRPIVPQMQVNQGLNTGFSQRLSPSSFAAPATPLVSENNYALHTHSIAQGAQAGANITPTQPFMSTGYIRPSTANIQTTPSGVTVNAKTGGVVSTPPATPQLPGVDNNYTMQPGETADAYNARVAAYNASKDASTPTVPDVSGATTTDPNAPATTTDQGPLSGSMFTSPEYEAALKAYNQAQELTPEEIANKQSAIDLKSAYNSADTNTAHQPIELSAVTGQQKNIQDQYLNMSGNLQNEASLLQAKRTANLEASKFALDTAESRLSALRDFSKPVALGYGGSLVQPRTADGTAAGTVIHDAFGGSTDLIGTALTENRLTPDLITRYGIPFLGDALKKDPGYNFVLGKASNTSDTDSLKTQQGYFDTTKRSYDTATANLGVLQKFMADNHINSSGIPSINDLDNWAKSKGIDPGSVAAFKSSLEGLRAEYAQVLSRGGTVTDTSRNSANSLIPDNLSPSALAKVATQLNQEGSNALKEAQGQINIIQGRMKNGKTNFGTKTTDSGTFKDGTASSDGSLIFKDGKWQKA